MFLYNNSSVSIYNICVTLYIQMEIIFLLIAVSLSMAVFFLMAFLWAVKDKQFDDDRSPSVRMLMDNSKKHKN